MLMIDAPRSSGSRPSSYKVCSEVSGDAFSLEKQSKAVMEYGKDLAVVKLSICFHFGTCVQSGCTCSWCAVLSLGLELKQRPGTTSQTILKST